MDKPVLDTITFNGIELLMGQTMEFLFNRTLSDCKSILSDSINIVPKFLKNAISYGVTTGISKEFEDLLKIQSSLKETLEHTEQVVDLVKVSLGK